MYWIVTDTAIDMPKHWIDAQVNFRTLPLACLMDGEVYIPDGRDETTREIYQAMRNGKLLSTSQVTPETWADAFRDVLRQGSDILCIPFSSGLSGTCAAAYTAAGDVQDEFPDRRIIVVDSLCASAGQGLLIHHALRNRENGMSLEENAVWVRENVQNVVHWFTVSDLMHLHRGGRVSAASAIVGTLAQVKPIMHCDENGKLAVWEKCTGRKRSIRMLAEKIRQNIVHPEDQLVFISHGDCADEAEALADMIRQSLPVAEVRLSYVGPVIGAHTGPGVIAVFCLGESRIPKK